jgi:hypothetical protein
MDAWDTVRALGLIGLFGWCVAIVAALFLARGQPLNIYHRKTLSAGLLLVSFWAFMLLITMKSMGMFSREASIPFSASALGGGVFLLWTWLVLSAKLSFTVRRTPRKIHHDLSTFAGD